MAKRKRKNALNARMGDGDVAFHMDAIDVTRARMPRYNGFQCRGGVHGDVAYNRRRVKAETARLIAEF